MNRLDAVLGPENWWDEYAPGENSVLCRLTVRLPDGSILTKADAGGYAGMPDSGDDDKSGFSDAFKRAAVKFGVGRYLYRDGVPDFVTRPRRRPVGLVSRAQPCPRPDARPGPAGRRVSFGPVRSRPRSGRALFAWTKEQEQRHEVGLLKYLNGWAKLQDYPGRMVDWDAEQVGLAYGEACRKLQSTVARPTAKFTKKPSPTERGRTVGRTRARTPPASGPGFLLSNDPPGRIRPPTVRRPARNGTFDDARRGCRVARPGAGWPEGGEMPELRKDPIVGRWVIIALERAKRPHDFKPQDQSLVEAAPARSARGTRT